MLIELLESPMSENWYYVEKNERRGPVSEDELAQLFQENKINGETFVWVKGFENWVKSKEVDQLASIIYPKPIMADLPKIKDSFNWNDIPETKKIFAIKIGPDRGENEEIEYGPFDIETLKKAAKEDRINEKTFIYTQGMEDWKLLGEVPLYEILFPGKKVKIEEKDKRNSKRRPFVARMLFQSDKQVYEGVCRDVSIGGLQVLVSDLPIQVGDEISMNVHPQNNNYSFVASGKVVRLLEGGQGFSLRFKELNKEAQKAINQYLEGNS